MAMGIDQSNPQLLADASNPGQFVASGDWTFHHAEQLRRLLESAGDSLNSFNGLAISRMDATGSYSLLHALKHCGISEQVLQLRPEHRAMIDAVRLADLPLPPKPAAQPWYRNLLYQLGVWVDSGYRNTRLLLGFLGQVLSSLVMNLFKPKHWRLTSIVFHMQAVGLNALPLVMLLSFMIGAVVAFLGATVLSEFGAQVWVVELVGVAFYREFGVLLTAILLAGRTASAFTAQIGSMKSGEELDAIRTMGLDPIELLVLPRIMALLLTLPLLTFMATMAGLLGGMAVCYWNLGISPEVFIGRLHSELAPRHIWIGMSKAPVFALVIGLIGCLEGFKVKGNAQSVGEHTTSSVVQAISLVILLDALAAMFYMELDL
jgi:phospholipid/cholesterol/gamma-HCH transport system permease protein